MWAVWYIIGILDAVPFIRQRAPVQLLPFRDKDQNEDEALGSLPASLRLLFEQATLEKDQEKSEEVIKQLDKVFERAIMDKDLLDLDCQDKRDHYSLQLKSSKALHESSATTLTRTQSEVEHTQQKSSEVQARLHESTRLFKKHKYRCQEERKRQEKELEAVQADILKSKKIHDAACKACGSSLKLKECQQEDGTVVIVFDDPTLRAQVKNLNVDAQQFLDLNLERTVYGHEPVPTSFITFKRTQYFRRLRKHTEETCTEVKAPSCEAFKDLMGTFIGNVQDLVDDLDYNMILEEQKCQDAVTVDAEAIKVARQELSDLNVALSIGVESTEEAQQDERRLRSDWQDLAQDAHTTLGTCEQQLHDIESTMCKMRKLRDDVVKLNLAKEVPFLGDCRVTEWLRGPCTEMCGPKGGMQNITREVISESPLCPPLLIQRQCNVKACPRDCKMTPWGRWSKCSKDCGGGAQSRIRSIEEEPQNGALPCADTVQERLCNHQACDQECVLSEWSSWSGCSRSCLKGYQVRKREILMKALGNGKCPSDTSKDRRQKRRCNDLECASPTPKCNSTLDVVFVMDSSGSMGATGFAQVTSFVDILTQRFNDLAQVSLIDFGTKAELRVPLGGKDALLGAIASITWRKSNTNTADALTVAEEALQNGGRKTAQSVVLVITDGMPNSKHATEFAVQRLKTKSRLMFLTIGDAVNRRVMKKWASWPSHDNIQREHSFHALNATVATELVTMMCASLEQ